MCHYQMAWFATAALYTQSNFPFAYSTVQYVRRTRLHHTYGKTVVTKDKEPGDQEGMNNLARA